MKLKTIICLALLLLMVGAVSATNYKKVVGGDISMLNKYMEAGKIYYDANGNTLANTPAFLAYLKAQGLNSMRVRLFVDPSNASSTHKGEGELCPQARPIGSSSLSGLLRKPMT